MTGDFKFRLTSKRVCYEFMVYRKIMRITGESASGKSELIRQLLLSENPKTGVVVNCRYKCKVINNDRFENVKRIIENVNKRFKNHTSEQYREIMRESLEEYHNTLFFADEDFDDLGTKIFAQFCKFTDSFFVLICRDYLSKLPYSFTEIYRIKKSGKFHYLENLYRYEDFQKITDDEKHLYLTEDSNAGFEFFQNFYDFVETAEGKSKLCSKIEKIENYETINIIADGAAFGSEIDKLLKKLKKTGIKFFLFLPESFEYLLLSSELFASDEVRKIVQQPSHIIDGNYFSWEQYFNLKLMEITNGLANEYTKKQLNTCYVRPCCHKNKSKCNLYQSSDKKRIIMGRFYIESLY